MTFRESNMKIQFPLSQIKYYATKYENELNNRDKRLSQKIAEQVFPIYKKRGYLTKREFTTVCEWKTPRTKSRCETNAEEMVREISSIAVRTECEQLRIEIWNLLVGVGWPTASVFLHFAFPDQYPILDFRALESLGVSVPKKYSFSFWQEYTCYCRDLAKKAAVSLRMLDEALWKYSQLHPI
jgi:hypothetical protein